MKQLKQQVIEAGKQIADSHLVVGTWGNLSARLPGQNRVVITPSGMDYLTLTPEDLVVVDLQGQILEGSRKPSSEMKMHLAVYQNRQDVNAVVHTHSIHASACAVAGIAIPPIVEDMVQLLGGSIDVAPYVLPGTEELAQGTVQALGPKNAALLANHGVAAVGRNMEEAVKAAFMVEKSAQIFINARSIGQPMELSAEDVRIMREGYLYSYGQK